MLRLFTDHPASVGETYLEHFRFATGVGARMVAGGCACIAHGLLPFLFVTTGSRTIRALANHLNAPRGGTKTQGAAGYPVAARGKLELELQSVVDSLNSAAL